MRRVGKAARECFSFGQRASQERPRAAQRTCLCRPSQQILLAYHISLSCSRTGNRDQWLNLRSSGRCSTQSCASHAHSTRHRAASTGCLALGKMIVFLISKWRAKREMLCVPRRGQPAGAPVPSARHKDRTFAAALGATNMGCPTRPRPHRDRRCSG